MTKEKSKRRTILFHALGIKLVFLCATHHTHSQCLSILIFKANAAHLIIETIVDTINMNPYRILDIFILEQPHLVYSSLAHHFICYSRYERRKNDKNEDENEKKKKKTMSASPKCLFNAYIHTHTMHTNIQKRNWYWWLCKGNPINWKCTYRAMRILKTKKGRLLNLNHNLFVLKIRRNAKMETQTAATNRWRAIAYGRITFSIQDDEKKKREEGVEKKWKKKEWEEKPSKWVTDFTLRMTWMRKRGNLREWYVQMRAGKRSVARAQQSMSLNINHPNHIFII